MGHGSRVGAWGNRGNGAGSAEVMSGHVQAWESSQGVGWSLEVSLCPMDKSWGFGNVWRVKQAPSTVGRSQPPSHYSGPAPSPPQCVPQGPCEHLTHIISLLRSQPSCGSDLAQKSSPGGPTSLVPVCPKYMESFGRDHLEMSNRVCNPPCSFSRNILGYLA